MSSKQIAHDSRGAVRVLVADADDKTRSFYCESLKLAGCDVVHASDGRDALVKALSHRPTLVITETRLPLFNGYELCEELRRDSTTRGVPILLVTTETRPTELDRARKAGADVVFNKPVSLDVLLQAIQQLLLASTQSNESATPDGASTEPRRTSLAKAHPRFETRTPPAAPLELVCPSCGSPLIYKSSHVGGISSRHPEQWDDYTCPASCGTFVYRHRTRKLRRAG